jgi:hypothetical protein
MRIFKGLSILVASGGVAALAFAGVARPPALLALDRLNPAMNFAFVRVEGVVVSRVELAPDGAYLAFTVQDASGRVRVSAYRQAVAQLRAASKLPRPGDRLTIDGTLRIRDEEPVLVLNAARDLQLVRPPPIDVQLSAIDALHAGERASTRAQLRAIKRIRDGFWLLSLRDGSATLDVPLIAQTAPALEPGTWLQIEGAVGEYRDAKQLLVDDDAELTRAAPKPPDLRPIDALNPDLNGEWVALRGDVVDILPFKNGVRLALSDASGASIDAILFDRVWQALPFSATLQAGDSVQVSGALGDYRGRAQVVPELPADVTRAP